MSKVHITKDTVSIDGVIAPGVTKLIYRESQSDGTLSPMPAKLRLEIATGEIEIETEAECTTTRRFDVGSAADRVIKMMVDTADPSRMTTKESLQFYESILWWVNKSIRDRTRQL